MSAEKPIFTTLVEQGPVKSGLNIDPVVLSPQQYGPKIRGLEFNARDSLPGFLSLPPYQWMLRDRKGFEQALGRDPELNLAYSAANELLEGLQMNSLTASGRLISSLAITERALEIAVLAEPHIPRRVNKKLEYPEFDPKLGEWKKELEKFWDQFKKPEPQHTPTPDYLAWLLSKINMLGDSAGNHAWEALQKLGFGKLRHPSLEDVGEVGRERFWKLTNDQEIMATFKGDAAFIINKVFNQYDPVNGLLSVVSTRELEDVTHQKNRKALFVPLGVINPDTQEEISIPSPLRKSNARVASFESKDRSRLSCIQIRDGKTRDPQQAEVLVVHDELAPYVSIDQLGNLYISTKDLDPEIKAKLVNRKITLQADFVDQETKLPPISPLIGPLPKEEQYRLNLYPPQIVRYINILKDKKARGVRGYSTNQEIFTRLTQFLGSIYLEYDLLDANSKDGDPIGFTLTERVLARRKASCEGANIALGTLMRYFLEEGEGIAFVEGFNTVNGVARASNFHLKVLYQASDGRETLFDATPWPKQYRQELKKQAKKVAQARREWAQIARHSEKLQKLILEQIVRDAQNRLTHSWVPNDFEWRERLGKNLGNFDGQSRLGHQLNILISPAIIPVSMDQIPEDNGAMFLMSFLKGISGMDSQFLDYWTHLGQAIDSSSKFNLRLLQRQMFGELVGVGLSLGNYTSRNGKDKLISDRRFRAKLFKQMEEVISKGEEASIQNAQVFTRLGEEVAQLAEEYRNSFKVLFKPYRHQIGTDLDSFIEGAPFLLLIPNPLKELSNFFTRSAEKSTQGFIYPESPEDIRHKAEQRLESWRIGIDKRFLLMQAELDFAPTFTTRDRERVDLSSTMLWEVSETVQLDHRLDKNGEGMLDPLATFNYLYEVIEADKKNLPTPVARGRHKFARMKATRNNGEV